MAFDADFGDDFCLYCDSQVTRGAYCSEACRQADRKSSQYSASHARQPSTSSSSAGTSWTSQARHSAAYSLPSRSVYPPPSRSSVTRASLSSVSSSSRQPSPADYSDPKKRGSVASLDLDAQYHLSRSYNKSGISEGALKELARYESSFDTTRQDKMRAYAKR